MEKAFQSPQTKALLHVIGPALRRLRQGDENLEETLTLGKNKIKSQKYLQHLPLQALQLEVKVLPNKHRPMVWLLLGRFPFTPPQSWRFHKAPLTQVSVAHDSEAQKAHVSFTPFLRPWPTVAKYAITQCSWRPKMSSVVPTNHLLLLGALNV